MNFKTIIENATKCQSICCSLFVLNIKNENKKHRNCFRLNFYKVIGFRLCLCTQNI